MKALTENTAHLRRFVNTQTAEKFKHLYENGESTCSIARKFGFDNKTVYKHLRKLGLKLRSKKEAIKLGVKRGRIKLPTKPHCILLTSSKLTLEKAYILGVLAGDGWLDYSPNGRRYHICLETVDEEFADEFRRCLNKVYGLNAGERKLIEKHPGWSDKYSVRLCCKAACEDLLSHDVSFRHDEWRVPSKIENARPGIQASYLKGFFDSEGCVEKNGQRIQGTSSYLPGLKDISALIRNLGIRFKIICNNTNKNVYNIRIQDRTSVELFARHVGFTIMRKRSRLQRGLASYKLWITPPGETAELEPEMRRLRDSGLTYEEIAEKLNLGAMTVWNHLNRNSASAKTYTRNSRNSSCSSKNKNGGTRCEQISGDVLNVAILGSHEPDNPSDALAVVSGSSQNLLMSKGIT